MKIYSRWSSKTVVLEFDGETLRGADLGDANLGDANLRGANLRDANLRDANLSRSVICDANFEGAKITYRHRTVIVHYEKVDE